MQIITIITNSYAQARNSALRNRFEVIAVDKSENLKKEIWQQLLRVGRGGGVLVKWQDKLYLCEMKQDLKGYTRTEIEYHPYMNQF